MGAITADFRQQVAELRPRLMAAAIALTRNATDAEDLVSDAILKAMQRHDRYCEGSLYSWLNRLMRNHFIDQKRRPRHVIEDPDDTFASHAVAPDDHGAALEAMDIMAKMSGLPEHHRHVLMMTGQGYAMSEIAEAEHCEVGTVKSRLSRARSAFAALAGSD